ncbi:MAG: Ig-like domain-containing protein, partial [Vicinamibacterales bacterium]
MKHHASILAAVWLVWLVAIPPAAAQPPPRSLTVVNSGPTGETSGLEQASEIRVVFSEPMVVLGRIPQPVTAPFMTIRPAIRGTFRWSGTTILIFTPDPQRALPHATRYEVSIATDATAVSGRRLAAPHTFSFTTPTVKLLATEWYRKNKRYDTPMIVALRFNQPVRPANIVAHTTLRFEPHNWARPELSPEARARLATNDPQAIARFNTKVAAAAQAAAARLPLTFRAATDWDKKRFPPSTDLVVLEVTAPVPTESWVNVGIDATVPAIEGRALPRSPQSRRIEAERTFFVDGFRCHSACDPDRWNPVVLRRDIELARIQKTLSIREITAGKPNR